MSLKMKLASTVMAFILLVGMLTVGVFAVKQTQFSVGGNIEFKASGINATISAGTLSTTGSWTTGDGTGKMQEVEINTDKSASELETEYASWSGLDLAFNEAGDDVTISFSITNDSTVATEFLMVTIGIDDGMSSNATASVTPTGAAIAPGLSQDYVITFAVENKEVNAFLTGFKIDFEMSYLNETPVEGDTVTAVTLAYDENTKTASVTGYDWDTMPSEVVVPALVEKNNIVYAVTSIGTQAFCEVYLDSLTLPNSLISIGEKAFWFYQGSIITLPDNVTEIGPSAFYDATSLSSVKLPKNLVTIGDSAFISTGLSEITIPSKVRNIPVGCFVYCPFSKITVEEGNTTYDSRNNCNAIIETKTNTLIVGIENTVIPDSVLSIGDSAFVYKDIEAIDLPEGLIRIGSYAFGYCNLNTVSLPGSLLHIGALAFEGNPISELLLPENLISIGTCAFQGATKLKNVTIPASVRSLGDSIFANSAVESLTVDAKNPVYDSRENCNAIIETKTNTLVVACLGTVIPESVTSISGSFYGVKIENALISSNLTQISEEAFKYTEVNPIILQNELIASSLDSESAWGYLIQYTSTIYVKNEIVDNLNAYVKTNFTNVEAITSGEYAGYTKYSRVLN